MAEWPCCHDPLRFSPASLRFVPPPPFPFNFPPKLGEATHPTLACIFTYLLSLRTAFTYLRLVMALALPCRGFGLSCLALPCCALALACLGLALALPHSRHFDKVRLLEAWHGVALQALALPCLALRWHVVLGLGVPWPWHALALACLALACLALALQGISRVRLLAA